MNISEKEVRHIAQLARIGMRDEDVSFYTKEMSSILDYMETLQEVDLESEDSTEDDLHQTAMSVRQDTSLLFSAQSFSTVLRSMARATKGGFIKIKAVLDKDNG
ncbi:MAG: aspartyl/glutamyl-tRNA amidotransferase subunit C [Candidatus Spechtbacteria bacterium SB0662_bin_43]|uniref:Aspartyl/glutamyl-tRNA amidotransferase subunit C n=1 Tax=Candidatus Spechtbacteria bacterium SB0662_bin_43 TaxID=2604897 RepID=A0A845DKT5_9BACT|nr:aspartyl/glutamyl-tRNA amidotransferase subunit C [Candidatus Spechtbacteria bacterium SB0662_bin_43]